MHFTHLMPDHLEPSQDLLQKYENYLVIVVLSEEMRQLVLDVAKFDLGSSDDTLCQIVMPEHIELSVPGSLLHAFQRQLDENRIFPSTHHSFLAVSTRMELMRHPPAGGGYHPLLLNTYATQQEKIDVIKCTLIKALQRGSEANVSGDAKHALKVLMPAASLIASVLRILRSV